MKTNASLNEKLKYLKLAFFRQHHQELAAEAAKTNASHQDYLSQLVAGETQRRFDHGTQRRTLGVGQRPVTAEPPAAGRV